MNVWEDSNRPHLQWMNKDQPRMVMPPQRRINNPLYFHSEYALMFLKEFPIMYQDLTSWWILLWNPTCLKSTQNPSFFRCHWTDRWTPSHRFWWYYMKQCDDLIGECANDLRNVAHSRVPPAPLWQVAYKISANFFLKYANKKIEIFFHVAGGRGSQRPRFSRW